MIRRDLSRRAGDTWTARRRGSGALRWVVAGEQLDCLSVGSCSSLHVDDTINRTMVYCGAANGVVSLVHAASRSRRPHSLDVRDSGSFRAADVAVLMSTISVSVS